MAKEYIERQAAINAVTKDMGPYRTHDFNAGCARATNRIIEIPAADVAPVRHGTWIKADEQPYFRKHYHPRVCSECGKRKDGKWLYCPYCGSKNQDGGKDNG